MKATRNIKHILIELFFTTVLGSWVIFRLAVDAMSYAEPGWHTTVNSPSFQNLKLIGLLLVTIGIIVRVLMLIKEVIRVNRDKKL